MNYFQFIRSIPELIRPQLPDPIQGFEVRQPNRWIVQMHYGEPRLHYEVSRIPRSKDFELALHFEAKDKTLNRYLMLGLRRHLFEIRDTLGESIEVEMWDRGWTKLYERFPADEISSGYQQQIAQRSAEIMTCVHPIYIRLRQDVSLIKR